MKKPAIIKLVALVSIVWIALCFCYPFDGFANAEEIYKMQWKVELPGSMPMGSRIFGLNKVGENFIVAYRDISQPVCRNILFSAEGTALLPEFITPVLAQIFLAGKNNSFIAGSDIALPEEAFGLLYSKEFQEVKQLSKKSIEMQGVNLNGYYSEPDSACTVTVGNTNLFIIANSIYKGGLALTAIDDTGKFLWSSKVFSDPKTNGSGVVCAGQHIYIAFAPHDEPLEVKEYSLDGQLQRNAMLQETGIGLNSQLSPVILPDGALLFAATKGTGPEAVLIQVELNSNSFKIKEVNSLLDWQILAIRRLNEQEFAVLGQKAFVIFNNKLEEVAKITFGDPNYNDVIMNFLPTDSGDFIVSGGSPMQPPHKPSLAFIGRINRSEFVPVK